MAIFRKIFDFVIPKSHRINLVVLSHRLRHNVAITTIPDNFLVPENGSEVALSVGIPGLVIKKLVDVNDPDIDSLTAIDEWRISKSATVQDISNGCHGYIVKNAEGVVASAWVTQGNYYFDGYLKRKFELFSNESYWWRGFVVPEFRGRGISGSVIRLMLRDLAVSYGKTKCFVLVRDNNRVMIKSLQREGWSNIGCAGFVEIHGVRFHYLFGRKAFEKTRKRFYLARV